MKTEGMTSLQRVLTTLGHQEPDRVPMFLTVTMHGAKELGLSIPEYFSRAHNVVEGQLRLWKKYRNDCLYPFFYASLEIEAWGGETIFREDGPPNSGEPIIKKDDDILGLIPPSIQDSKPLQRVLEAIVKLKEKAKDTVPVIGVVMSPFSVPVMQMGFDHYLELIHERQDLFAHLMKINEKFCVDWANAQLAAGAVAIAYFDPVSSPTIIPRPLYIRTGFEIAQRVLSQIKGAAAIHLASGISIPIIDDIVKTGAVIIGASIDEDLKKVKDACRGKITVLGNLNGIEMRRWTPEQAEQEVKKAIVGAGKGGGFIISDNHGEIPWQVPDTVLEAISEAVHKWGNYPLKWTEQYVA